MQFIDKVTLKLKAGNGGNGIVAFKHVKYNPLGGPSGGDGGNGGSIIFKVDNNKSTLLDLRFTKQIRAEDGNPGLGNNKYGASKDDVIIKVPLGTVIKDLDTDEIIADLNTLDSEEVICRGGKGGKGNFHFKSSRDNAPDYCTLGTPGEEKNVLIELKLLADVGLVGFPSVGKSTLLSVVSNARPEIADYPFTTLKPQLGIVKAGDSSFVMADLPGLIEGASEGKGLGHEFLKHIERCRLIIHVLDMGREDPIKDYEIINDELKKYPGNLETRPQIVVANKMDLDEDKTKLNMFKNAYPDIEVFEVITLINEGLMPVLYKAADMLKSLPQFPLYNPDKADKKVVYKYEEPVDFTIFNEGNGDWRVEGEKIIRLFNATDFDNEDSIMKFSRALSKMKLDDALKEKGCKDGDFVYIKDYSFEYKTQEDDE